MKRNQRNKHHNNDITKAYFATQYSPNRRGLSKELNRQSTVLPNNLNYSSDTQEIPRTLWNPHVHYRVPDSPPRFPILSQMNLLHVFPSHFFKTHFNIILQSTRWSSKRSLFLQVSPPKCYTYFFSSPMRATCPTRLILIYFIILVTFGEFLIRYFLQSAGR